MVAPLLDENGGSSHTCVGARHAAALAITRVTDATAVAISASSGVSVYDDGETVLELEGAHSGS